MAWIGLVDMEIRKAPIGYYHEEKIMGNAFHVSVMAQVPLADPDADELGQTLNYEQVYQAVHKVMREPMDLIETAAYRIYRTFIAEGISFDALEIRIRKHKPMGLKDGGDSLLVMRFPEAGLPNGFCNSA